MNNVDKLGIVKVALFGSGGDKDRRPILGLPWSKPKDSFLNKIPFFKKEEKDPILNFSKPEPLWALTTGLGLTPLQAYGMHAGIRDMSHPEGTRARWVGDSVNLGGKRLHIHDDSPMPGMSEYDKALQRLRGVAEDSKTQLREAPDWYRAYNVNAKGWNDLMDVGPHTKNPFKRFTKWMLERQGSLDDIDLSKVPDNYNQMVRWDPKKHIGVLAHELGHATQPRWLKSPLYSFGRLSPLLGSLGALVTDDRETALTSAGLGTAGAIPMLAAEIDASRRGSNMLKGLSKHTRRMPWVGVPTYGLMAASPWISGGIKDMFGGYST